MLNRSNRADVESIVGAPGERRRGVSPKEKSVIGPTLTFKGEIYADEDLLIQGTFEGRVAHHAHRLTIGKEGRVKADIHARIIAVEGRLEGDLRGDEIIVLKKTANVTGNLLAPRVNIEDGARFNGGINTEFEHPVSAAADPAA